MSPLPPVLYCYVMYSTKCKVPGDPSNCYNPHCSMMEEEEEKEEQEEAEEEEEEL